MIVSRLIAMTDDGHNPKVIERSIETDDELVAAVIKNENEISMIRQQLNKAFEVKKNIGERLLQRVFNVGYNEPLIIKTTKRAYNVVITKVTPSIDHLDRVVINEINCRSYNVKTKSISYRDLHLMLDDIINIEKLEV